MLLLLHCLFTSTRRLERCRDEHQGAKLVPATSTIAAVGLRPRPTASGLPLALRCGRLQAQLPAQLPVSGLPGNSALLRRVVSLSSMIFISCSLTRFPRVRSDRALSPNKRGPTPVMMKFFVRVYRGSSAAKTMLGAYHHFPNGNQPRDR